MKTIFLLSLTLLFGILYPQTIPGSYSNLYYNEDNRLQLKYSDSLDITVSSPDTLYTLTNFYGNPTGDERGMKFDFNNATFNGKLYYGFMPYDDTKYPEPVFFKRSSTITSGKASIDILKMGGKYDMIGWQQKAKGSLGYRVVDAQGNMVYDGIVSFSGTGPFQVAPTIIEGPFVNNLTQNSAVISLTMNMKTVVSVKINGANFNSGHNGKYHEIQLDGLEADRQYEYSVNFADNVCEYHFKTAPNPGSRKEFTFAYISDSRGGYGGGERNVFGVNSYIIKRIMALANFKNSAFLQVSGDLIDGYYSNPEKMDLEYANWKRAVGSYGAYWPVVAAMGNHEALVFRFRHKSMKYGINIDRFPFESESAEAVFARNFVNPLNGPDSEDGSLYDPDIHTADFPSYKENVFYYTYDNTALVVLNSNYWYAPGSRYISLTSGNLHGYIMDNQLKWLENTMLKLEKDQNIDHVFITGHTPFFPNGGHVGDDMWYRGQNAPRPYIAGKAVEKGIIERRDQLLDIIVNRSDKVVAILTGDEHNYCKTEVGPNTRIYPDNYQFKKIKLSRTIYQVNNGAAGAPYYAQEETPWTPFTSGFTTQNAVVFFHVEGSTVELEVLNPLTFEQIDRLKMRE